MKKLSPFMKYFGNKYAASNKRYPRPKYDTIMEPFAGAAGYSVNHYDKNVVLIDTSKKIVDAWSFLINASPKDVLSLPLLNVGDNVLCFKQLSEGERALIQLNLDVGPNCVSLSTLALESPGSYWGEAKRKRISENVALIKHWKIIHGDYTLADDVEATWFIDPPYSGQLGRTYQQDVLDYAHLGEWCKDRKGQVIVCESNQADWLPFSPIGKVKGFPVWKTFSNELAWIRG